MRLRAHVVFPIAVLFALTQMLASATSEPGHPAFRSALSIIADRVPGVAVVRADAADPDADPVSEPAPADAHP